MDRRRYLSAVSATAMGVLSAGCSQTQTEQTRTEQSRALSLNWVFDTRNKAEIAARGDPLSMWVENCSTATADAILGTAESLSISFDWQLFVDGWWERPEFAIETVSGESVWSGGVDTDNADAKIFDIGPDEETSGAFRRSIEIPTDETVRARFALYPSQYCEAPDHLRTTLRIPSISITA